MPPKSQKFSIIIYDPTTNLSGVIHSLFHLCSSCDFFNSMTNRMLWRFLCSYMWYIHIYSWIYSKLSRLSWCMQAILETLFWDVKIFASTSFGQYHWKSNRIFENNCNILNEVVGKLSTTTLPFVPFETDEGLVISGDWWISLIVKSGKYHNPIIMSFYQQCLEDMTTLSLDLIQHWKPDSDLSIICTGEFLQSPEVLYYYYTFLWGQEYCSGGQ
jgi:hypothetical protein